MIETLDRRTVAESGRRTPQEKLVGRTTAAIRIPANQVDIVPLQVGGRKHRALADGAGQIGYLARELFYDAIGVGFAQPLAPPAVNIQPTGGVTHRPAWQFLQLQPQNPSPLR